MASNAHNITANLTADGNSPALAFPGGTGVLVASGTFGTGTLTVQWLDFDGGTWFSLSATLTAAGHVAFVAPAGSLRINLAGASTPDIQLRCRPIFDV